jgi:hypothetical protein
MRSEVLMAKNMNNTVSSDVTLCNAVHTYPNFGGTCHLHLQGGESGTDILRGSTRTRALCNPIEGKRTMKEYGAHKRFVFLLAPIRGQKISLQTYGEAV